MPDPKSTAARLPCDGRTSVEVVAALIAERDRLKEALRTLATTPHSKACDYFRAGEHDGCEFGTPDPACPGCVATTNALAHLPPGGSRE